MFAVVTSFLCTECDGQTNTVQYIPLVESSVRNVKPLIPVTQNINLEKQ